MREKVLVKAKKLYEHERELLLQRFDYIRKCDRGRRARAQARRVARRGRGGGRAADSASSTPTRRSALAELDDFIAFILKSNEPTVLAEGSFERLADIARIATSIRAASRGRYLTPTEVDALKLPRGSLTAQERLEIESHVVHTYNFLENIPWGRRLRDDPDDRRRRTTRSSTAPAIRAGSRATRSASSRG